MAGNKYLSLAQWKQFAKDRDCKDAALLKALGGMEKAGKAAPDLQLKTLQELEKAVDALVKVSKADKELLSYLGDMDEAIVKHRKFVELAAQGEQEAAETEGEGEDDEPASPQLSTRLIPLMRLVPKGEVLKAMVGVSGPDTAVLVSRKPIGNTGRKLLKEYLGGSVKYFIGDCLFEEQSHTFALKPPGSAMARRIKAALLEQTGQRYKVRARGVEAQ